MHRHYITIYLITVIKEFHKLRIYNTLQEGDNMMCILLYDIIIYVPI